MIDAIIKILYSKKIIPSWSFEKINESTNHDVYDVWDVVLKIDINKQQLYKEYLVLQQISDKTKCAYPLFFEQIDNGEVTYYVLGLEKIDWKTLGHYRSKLSRQRKEWIVDEIVYEVKNMHTYTLNGINEFPWIFDYFEYVKNKYQCSLEKVKSHPLISWFRDFSEIFYKLFVELSTESRKWLIHNDIRYKNILLSEWGEFLGIIDFEEALVWPSYVDYFRICDHQFFAQNYIEKWGEQYIEIEFNDFLISSFESSYSDAAYNITSRERLFYSIMTYTRLFSQFDESRYNPDEIERYRKKFLDAL